MTTIIIISLCVMLIVMAMAYAGASLSAKESERLCREVGDESDRMLKELSTMAEAARYWRQMATVCRCQDDMSILDAEILEEIEG